MSKEIYAQDIPGLKYAKKTVVEFIRSRKESAYKNGHIVILSKINRHRELLTILRKASSPTCVNFCLRIS